MRLKFVVVPGVLGSVSAQLLRRKEARLPKKSGEQPKSRVARCRLSQRRRDAEG